MSACLSRSPGPTLISYLSRNTKNVVYEPVPMAHVDVVDTVQGCAMEPLEGSAKILGERPEWRGQPRSLGKRLDDVRLQSCSASQATISHPPSSQVPDASAAIRTQPPPAPLSERPPSRSSSPACALSGPSRDSPIRWGMSPAVGEAGHTNLACGVMVTIRVCASVRMINDNVYC